ncbi:MAG TPA: four-helix bundle copper-binding protein [Longimicrobiaceae bacterium]|nr:four-helix bundle copper-binding protein [Longimicrobiaceae bacterium]
MTHIRDMLESHPRSSTVDRDALAECVQACFDCAQACTTCADACLGEEKVAHLISCIRLNQDCFDVCVSTGNILSRQTETNSQVRRAQLQACVEACRACAEECEKHAKEMEMEHCRVCAEACRRCEDACTRMLGPVAA